MPTNTSTRSKAVLVRRRTTIVEEADVEVVCRGRLTRDIRMDAARMALDFALSRMEDGGLDGTEVEPDEPRPRIFRDA